MIRQPTSIETQLAWHRATIAGLRPPRFEDEPEVGWYRRRFVKDGPFVPVRIWLDQDIDPMTGELVAPEEVRADWLGNAVDPVWVWPYCTAISRDAYIALVDLHGSAAAMAATHAQIDLTRTIVQPRRSAWA
jgi:hypothetical protein